MAGLVDAAAITAGRVPLLAPKGFFDEAVSENLIAGPAMLGRAAYQFGRSLPSGPQGTMGVGIGPGLAIGSRKLLRPSREIDVDGSETTLDGVRLRLMLTPGTEAPAEMNISFPDWKVIDLAENANVTQHNILTPRGAKARDTRAWVRGLTAAINNFPDAEVMITSHGWPRFGKAAIRDFLVKHRDAYAYLHDQTVRLMNDGLTGDAIAAQLRLPPSLAKEWYNRPYYGSLSFNARAVYQFYLGFYDGNPAHLVAMTPNDRGRRYVEAMGGVERVRGLAQAAYDKGDYAWAASLLNESVMAEDGAADRTLLARCYDQLAWQAENSLWRNMYLSAARDLRPSSAAPKSLPGAAHAMLATLPLKDLLELAATRLDPAKAANQNLSVAFTLTDTGEKASLILANSVLTRNQTISASALDATYSLSQADLLDLLFPTGASDETKIYTVLARIGLMLDQNSGSFRIVRPQVQ